ncbi:MAG TPA: hypothetical protein VEJ84_13320, partial [Acidimicrobiales bacterium]|nr:hypothetical protein [Acidimicrobiales bacterium]
MNKHASGHDSSASGLAATPAPPPTASPDRDGRPRRRPPPRPVEVVSVSRLAPRFVSVVLSGDGLR